ncbi:circularly permuted type 2 ATP-grasp protein [Amphritea sp. 1_MG-2023]|uniref:circularly permuted type 2 ATP-grasp protein n=1 Tax=Amphritea sp. 1_MG-2023 TaxID=3062670 RepID=UPI0026E21772|nr:circularly permuted type 2 ATP-grasp protein [Amphritea sp. 1_MG-2023]MDO6565340.1 circularly permuted type 2 ATP-grasp protein [Amphritea sp. 1_MG-2023]
METRAEESPDGLHYQAVGSGYDEVYGSQADIQPHWQYLLDGLKTLGSQGIHERQQKAERILRDDGATYNSGFPSNVTWQLDPVPALIASEEWASIESGLQERAELLDLVLKDLYGSRDLIRHGVLPPELLFSHGGFLRACDGLSLPGEHQLVMHATDMVRDHRGQMQVIGDRTQAPSGAGYALENRTVMSRVMPSLFRDSHVHRLSIFFQSLRHKLNSLASQITAEQPRIVILTPGSYNETYFEHTYLANYLGFPLVQGSDLRVSKGYLWMKSLGGLERVDVVLRRVDDFYCDPVELKSDSRLGVPGLLEVVRSGRVIVANPMGSGFLENPALLRYLPQIAQHFLGREAQLPSVKTYWCGDPQDLTYVIENIDKLVIKQCFRRPSGDSVFGSELDATERQALIKRIRQEPLYVAAQEYIRPSTTPSWSRNQLLPRPSVLRGFSVAMDSSYHVMPGGLTRVGSRSGSLNLSNLRGARSKDTWILASEPEKQVSLLESRPAVMPAPVQPHIAFPCRVVENLYWLGRYAIRAEAALRLLRTVFVQLNSTYHMPQETQQVLLQTVTQLTMTYPGFTLSGAAASAQPEAELLSVVLDGKRSGSVTANLNALLECSDQVREMLSADTQRVINDLRDELEGLAGSLKQGLAAAPEEALDPLVTTLLALSGLWQESMVRGLGWRFIDMGLRVEKALQAVSLIRASLVTVLPVNQQQQVLESVLLSSEVLITFRRRDHSGSDMAQGLALLLTDSSNPRSVFYQVDQLRRHLQELPSAGNGSELADEDRYMLEASSAIQLSNLDELVVEDEKTKMRVGLDQLLSRLQHLLQETSNQISTKYFDQIKVHQQLVRTDWGDEL